MRLTPPKKHIFLLSILLGGVAIIGYLAGVLGFIDGGFAAIDHYVFWLIAAGWIVLVAGVAYEKV